ncbi:hypothetical protein DFJ63DRAFT_314404 [Scheffersomyces coipomensis]|uniref:uncharacterized protein n=1 Tax=Scheffersomyces coipomensis TaxID=1788519 RepID=UPI00315CDBB9
MNYDPIHDTYVSSRPNTGSSADSNGSKKSIESNETTKSSQEPTQPTSKHNTLSISNLVSSPAPKTTSIANLINSDENENEKENNDENENANETHDHDHEHDEEDDDDDEYDTDGNSGSKGSSSKKKKRKYTNSTIPKCRHLKKSDGEPFWRKDIQYDFLKALFDDPTECFTNSFPHSDLDNANNNPKIPFADLYIRTLAESSKCSRILKERLVRDKRWSSSVAKVCLLVNAGRMNTTINFVPEMRSTLRTYHSIPSLQADPSSNGIQLQDTPRLKSILKAVCEDDNKPRELDEILKEPFADKPNTNVFQLVFLLSNRPNGIPYHHEDLTANLFMEFFLNPKIHPENRAKRFLWLLYTYLETDFTKEEMEKNPFGGATIPPLEYIAETDLNRFDIDTDYEIEYSESMYTVRTRYLKDDSNPRRRLKRDDNDEYDSENISENEVETKKKPEEQPKKKRVKRIPTTSIPSSTSSKTSSSDKNGHKKEIIDEVAENNNTAEFINNKIKFRVNAIEFPIDNLSKLVKSYTGNNLPTSKPVESNAISFLKAVLNESKPIIREVRTSSKASTASFNKKTTILGSWIYRYFNYKKSIGNKLLGMEWEEIRYDLANGLENFIYQQFGRSLLVNTSNHDHSDENDKDSKDANDADANGEKTSHSREFDDILTYLPQYDFAHVQEKNTFILQLMTFCDDWFIKQLKNKESLYTRGEISFDLENNSLEIKD